MRGIGGPLLCIGDLLSDVGEEEEKSDGQSNIPTIQPPRIDDDDDDDPCRLNQLFQENYHQLNKALAGTDDDDSWTSLTLKLCTALDTANKLIHSANSNALLLSHKVAELDNIINNSHSAITHLRSIHTSLTHRISSTPHTQP